ncbi:MAG: hypothetical protein ACD_49C00026G0030 [uncultured bacterium (gcode 4)]|uniref:Uncharacterized protein n=1 Tax=uncultured bacterium (gcode 4) TaxID=1234023 RepID=K2AFC6_9BACT|nr:MAG: hypothetical protein ACD_49C00026G0030 [uncultured bacterium (gcode 4)]
MEKFKKYLINTILILIFISILIIIFNFLKFEISKLILDYIKVIIWPLLILFWIFRFEVEIKNFINNIKKFTLPWWTKFETEKEEINQNKEDIKDELNLDDLFWENNTSFGEQNKSELQKTKEESFFDRVYIYIFWSQIELMQSLKNLWTIWINYIDISAYFEKTRSLNIDNYPYDNTENWLSFLMQNNLIEEYSNSIEWNKYIRITQFWVNFMDYINEKEYLKWNSSKNF